jgi:hypothetical protein
MVRGVLTTGLDILAGNFKRKFQQRGIFVEIAPQPQVSQA